MILAKIMNLCIRWKPPNLADFKNSFQVSIPSEIKYSLAVSVVSKIFVLNKTFRERSILVKCGLRQC